MRVLLCARVFLAIYMARGVLAVCRLGLSCRSFQCCCSHCVGGWETLNQSQNGQQRPYNKEVVSQCRSATSQESLESRVTSLILSRITCFELAIGGRISLLPFYNSAKNEMSGWTYCSYDTKRVHRNNRARGRGSGIVARICSNVQQLAAQYLRSFIARVDSKWRWCGYVY